MHGVWELAVFMSNTVIFAFIGVGVANIAFTGVRCGAAGLASAHVPMTPPPPPAGVGAGVIAPHVTWGARGGGGGGDSVGREVLDRFRV